MLHSWDTNAGVGQNNLNELVKEYFINWDANKGKNRLKRMVRGDTHQGEHERRRGGINKITIKRSCFYLAIVNGAKQRITIYSTF
jgi:hypothetical protein